MATEIWHTIFTAPEFGADIAAIAPALGDTLIARCESHVFFLQFPVRLDKIARPNTYDARGDVLKSAS